MGSKDIKLHNEDVQEILSSPPRSLIRWGSSIIAFIILAFFIGSFFFRYPDIIYAEVTITTENPPTWIVARSTGKLKEIYVNDHKTVDKGEILAVIENSSNTKDVLNLKQALVNFQISDSIINFAFINHSVLGEIQDVYSLFRKMLEKYNNFFILNLYGQKIKSKKRQLEEYEKYIVHLLAQTNLNKRTVYLSENEFKREEILYKKDLSTLSAYESSEKELLSTKQSLEQLMATVANTRITIAQLQNELVELQTQKIEEHTQLKIELQSSFEALNTSIKDWEQSYLLTSPIYGILSYNEIWKEFQYVNEGDKIFSIVSGNAGKIIGRMQFSVEGSGKVQIGQRVNIQINGYPYLEYGFLTGEIASISMLPEKEKYTAVVTIPQVLITSYNKHIILKGELSGSAEIVTDNQSLGTRLLSPFRYIFKKYI